ncbi:hypothetical protein COCCADRAFT_89765, partial [Bipolaris zeicola 26-R-13]
PMVPSHSTSAPPPHSPTQGAFQGSLPPLAMCPSCCSLPLSALPPFTKNNVFQHFPPLLSALQPC